MPHYRDILAVVSALPAEVDGLSVRQPLPRGGMSYLDPFLLLHHMGPVHFPGGQRPQEYGFVPHPHRGFEAVTFVYQGGVHHRDSRGNDHVVHAGGVQWLTAGMGIVHSERPPRELVESGGDQEIIQLWVNLPARDKWIQPRYQGFDGADIPRVTFDDGRVTVQVVAGKFEGVAGPVATRTSVLALNAEFHSGGRYSYLPPDGHTAFIYLLDGHCLINEEKEAQGEQLVRFGMDGGGISMEARKNTRVLIMAGEPLHEHAVRSGPYVMNSETEILEAVRDAQMGRMGVLIEEF